LGARPLALEWLSLGVGAGALAAVNRIR
jgi:hypothetical protein